MRRRLVPWSLLVAALAAGPVRAPVLAAADPAAARRLLGLLGAVGQEYAEALDETGAVVRPIEIEEARLFLAEARDLARGLDEPALGDLPARLDAVAEALAARVPEAELVARIAAVRGAVEEATGVAEETLPPGPPSPAHGRALFETHCVSCHGAGGRGDGPEAARLDPRPADFTDPVFMRGETPLDFFHVIGLGRRTGGMPPWEDILSVQDRWDVVSYLWSLGTPLAAVAEGQGVFLAQCASCHGATGDGRGPYAERLLTPVPDLTAPGRLATVSDAALFAAVTDGVPGTAMPAFREPLAEAARWKAVAFLRRLALGGAGGAEGAGAAASDARALDDVRRGLAAAVAAYRAGAADAGAHATDAYLAFEPLEPRLRANDPALVTRIEEGFLGLRIALRTPGEETRIDSLAAALGTDLDAAHAALVPTADGWARFVQSATIMLREGLEVVLIIGALLAWVTRAGNAGMRRPIYAGTAAGVVASVATAALLATVFALAPGLGDVLEGAAMLLAAVVLFWVSYWIVSKSEAERWQRYIQGRVQHALDAGSGVGLAAAAFLAVYREGFETVLFYQALLGGGPRMDVWVIAGAATGLGVLAAVYAVFRRLELRIPIRQFFLVTGAFLCTMAVVMAGKGVRELQEAAVMPITPLAWVPQLDVVGLFPTLETVLAQAVLVGLVLAGVVVTLRRRGGAAGEPGAGHVRHIRSSRPAERRRAG